MPATEPAMKPEPTADKILVVDDNESNRYTVGPLSEERPVMKWSEAGNGRGRRCGLAAERPALVILDIQMPDMTGFEVCKYDKVRARHRRHSGAAYLGDF